MTELAAARHAVLGQSLTPVPVPPIGRVVRRLRDAALCLDDGGEAVSFDCSEWLRRHYGKPDR